MQSELVLQGYTVICIDHPGEPPVPQVPYTNISVHGTPLGYEWGRDLDFVFRVNDSRKSIFDVLLIRWPGLVPEYGAPLNTSSYLHFSFSVGGSIGTYLVSEYEEVLAGIDYDGAFLDRMRNSNAIVDLKKPFLYSMHQLNGPMGTRPIFFDKQMGWYEQRLVNGTDHLDFSDIGLCLDLLDLRDEAPDGSITGTLNGFRMYGILREFTTGFFEGVLGKGKLELGRGLPNAEGPKVDFVDGSPGEEY